jgi:hypothetical protein
MAAVDQLVSHTSAEKAGRAEQKDPGHECEC